METWQLTDDVIAAHINASTPFWLNDPDPSRIRTRSPIFDSVPTSWRGLFGIGS